MKLVQYSEKDRTVGNVLDLEGITVGEGFLIKEILEWQKKSHFFSRNNTVIFCQSFEYQLEEPDNPQSDKIPIFHNRINF